MFQVNMPYDPYKLYLNGDLSIVNLLSTNALKAVEPTIQCDIIESKNSMQLHQSDSLYLYKPTLITSEKVDEIEYYKMVYEIPSQFKIPYGVDFQFTDYCFNNYWHLRFAGNTWIGENCKGHLSCKVLNKLNKRNENNLHNSNRAHACYVMIANNTWNNECIKPNIEDGLMMHLYNITKNISFTIP